MLVVRCALLLLLLPAAFRRTTAAGTQLGPSTKTEPYLVPLHSSVTVTSILTVGDAVPNTSDPTKSYPLAGITDGMGAYLLPTTPDLKYNPSCRPKISAPYKPAASSTFTLLVAHEIRAELGVVRRHGATGAFISELIIDRDTLEVKSGEDLIKQVVMWNTITSKYNPPVQGVAMNRFCSADLPPIRAFYDAKTAAGTKTRIFMNGEETTPNGRAFAHIATGGFKGTTYELPRLGKSSWENQVACPFSGAKTVVIGLDDSTDGQMYVYVGDKQKTGSVIDRAGLTNGKLYGIAVAAFTTGKEPNVSLPLSSSVGSYGPFRFTLQVLNGNGDVSGLNSTDLEAASDAAKVTRWARPEDGHWHPVAGKDGSATFYFATTASFTGRSRLWKLVFDNALNPLAGGTVTAVVEGSELAEGGTPKMMDNLVATCDGSVYIQEDPGSQDYISRVWRYNPKDGLIPIAQHNPKFFQPNVTDFLTKDEESSGIISADGMVNGKVGCYFANTQAHYSTTPELVEGGQIMMICVAPAIVAAPKQPALAP